MITWTCTLYTDCDTPLTSRRKCTVATDEGVVYAPYYTLKGFRGVGARFSKDCNLCLR